MNNSDINVREWLLSHGYSQWGDGVWNSDGYEIEAEALLQHFIDSQIKEGKSDE